MVHRPAEWFRNVTVGSAVIALLLVPVIDLLLHTNLPLWLHVPAILLVLTLMAGGAVVAGITFVEYRARSASEG